ncbi:MAG: sigma-54 dependent transcriptional regulator [Deltaproteobacteria bacterium]|jgi:two-component system response regulator GlrR
MTEAGAGSSYRRIESEEEVDFAELGLIGGDPSFLHCLSLARRFSRGVAPILVYGETGTGKELIARAIHYAGPRSGGPFVPVNCGGIPESLVESELFGHVRGAFTDAYAEQRGLVALADCGTLFLDEVDSLSPRAQTALLRFVQDRRFRPVGSERDASADVALVTASNRSLGKLVEAGQFRRDLFFRLDVATLRVPPLRERSGDIPDLCRHILAKLGATYRCPAKIIHPPDAQRLQEQPWVGNIRELENRLHRAWLVSDGPYLEFEWETAPDEPHAELDLKKVKREAVAAAERRVLLALMKRTQGNVSRAAALAQHERRAFGRLLKKHGIDRNEFIKR